MRAYMESGFYIVYLAFAVGAGVFTLRIKPRRRETLLFGAACVLLGCGDAFHLVPRAVGLFTGALDAPGPALAAWLGVGKLITSVTMTGFYLLLWFYLFRRAGKKPPVWANVSALACAAARIALCAFPQNGWLTNESPLFWGVLRNVPFVLLGAMVAAAAFCLMKGVPRLRFAWLLCVLSFAFYLPVVLFAGTHPWVGALMLPKTLCYALLVFCGCRDAAAG